MPPMEERDTLLARQQRQASYAGDLRRFDASYNLLRFQHNICQTASQRTNLPFGLGALQGQKRP